MDAVWILCIAAIAVALGAVVTLLYVITKKRPVVQIVQDARETQERQEKEAQERQEAHEALFESRMEQMLAPLKEKLETFRSVVTQTHALQLKDRADLQAQIKQLVSVNHTLGQEARQLSTALKNDNKKQGDWGETHLITLLEQGGLKEGIHFNVQVTRRPDGTSIRNQNGMPLRPDVIINLPDKKMIIVDAKTSLKAYMEYVNADTESQRQAALKHHVLSVKRHITELGMKDYPAALPDACGHVLMYIPTENAYLAAMQADPSLWKYAYNNNVTMVTATHLFSVVQLLAQLWRQDDQEKNVIRIATEGGKLYDKLVVFVNYFSKIEDTVQTLHKRIDDAKRTLYDGSGNLLQKAEKMRELGAKTYKHLPDEYVALMKEEEENAKDAENGEEKA